MASPSCTRSDSTRSMLSLIAPSQRTIGVMVGQAKIAQRSRVFGRRNWSARRKVGPIMRCTSAGMRVGSPGVGDHAQQARRAFERKMVSQAVEAVVFSRIDEICVRAQHIHRTDDQLERHQAMAFGGRAETVGRVLEQVGARRGFPIQRADDRIAADKTRRGPGASSWRRPSRRSCCWPCR